MTRDRFAAAFEKNCGEIEEKMVRFRLWKAEKTQQTASWGGWKKNGRKSKEKRIKRNEDGRDDRA